MFRYFIFTLFVSCVIQVQTDGIEDLKLQYVQHIMDCSQKFPITHSDLEMLRNKQMPNSIAVKCIFSCAYHKAGIMANGYLSVEKLNALSEKYLSDDAEKLRNAKKFAEACQSVNYVDLTNRDQMECERAALIFQCSLDKASQFNFIA